MNSLRHLHPKRPNALGLDFGRVIMCPPDRVEGADTEFLTLPEDDALAIAPPAGAFEIIASLVLKFQGRVHIVSKAGPRIQRLTQEWLQAHHFFEATGMPRSALHFCRERKEKRDHALKLKLTHFVDDRLDVLEHLKDVVPHRYLFGSHVQVPLGTVHVPDWPALQRELLPVDGDERRAE